MLPRFEIVARHRPVSVVGVRQTGSGPDAPPSARGEVPLPRPAPFAGVEVAWDDARGAGAERVAVHLRGPDRTTLTAVLEAGRVRITTALPGGGEQVHASRRHGRCRTAPDALGLLLTGRHVAALVREAGVWVVRCGVDLTRLPGAPDTRDEAWPGGLHAGWDAERPLARFAAGGAGQLGLRDVRLVTDADGTPHRTPAGAVLFTATSAGPGFFDTAHTSVWEIDVDGGAPVHRGALYFRRPDLPGVHGEHATHLLRDGDRWLVATSTWSTLPSLPRERDGARIDVVLGAADDDLTRGEHVVTTRRLDLPAPAGTPSVGVWDPHLVRDPAGGWVVGYVSARRFFDFHPVVAAGPDLDRLTVRGAATDRRATEGTTLLRVDGGWRVLASDGRDNPRGRRRRYPAFDLDLAERSGGLREDGAVDAPYPTNIPWPSVVPPRAEVPGDRWSLVTFDGTPAGGRLPGYGTHGDLVVMREAPSS